MGEVVGQAGLLAGRRALILGVANDHSIAWGIARAFAAHGAELAFTYQGEGFERRVIPLAESVGSKIVLPADVQDAASLDALFERVAADWGRIDVLVHAIAYSDKAELDGRFLDTSRANFLNSLDISCYSLVDLTRRAAPLMGQRRLGADADLPRGAAGDAELQRHGGRQGGAGERGALPRQRPRAAGHPRQRDLARADADAGGGGDRRLAQGLPRHRAQHAAARQRHASTRSAAPPSTSPPTSPPAPRAR